MESSPIIALVGRPNVGKSTVFNRLVGRREAITSEIAGTTRDRHFGVAKWYGHSWTLVDTAGLIFEDDPKTETQDVRKAMDEQVAIAIESADIIALVVDAKHGHEPDDDRIMESLRKGGKPVIVLANKADNPNVQAEAEAFRKLGAKEVFPVSAIHGRGMGDVAEYLTNHFPNPDQSAEPHLPSITFIGRPNVGKSSLINAILGEDRVIVSQTPGTTRDSIAAPAKLPNGQEFIFIDTAGIRRRGKIEKGVEQFSLFRTLRAINQSDIVVHILTIEEPPTRGDAHITAYALEAKKQVVLVLNKTDLAKDAIHQLTVQKKNNLAQRFLKRFAFMAKLPIVFVSALTEQGIPNLIEQLTKMVKADQAQQTRRRS
jgi:GTP-binding protein